MDETGPPTVATVNGDIAVGRVVEHAERNIEVRNVCGDIRIGEVVRGAVQLASIYGGIEVGVR